MPPALSAKFAGLPRWAWLAILAGGLTIGLILRSRQEDAEEEEVLEEDLEPITDPGMLGDPGYEFEDEFGQGGLGTGSGVVYPPPNLPSAVPPPNVNIDIDLGGGKKGKGGKGNCGKRPKRDPRRGKKWHCNGTKWVQVDKNRSGKNGKDAKTRGPLTGGGPPARRSSHQPAPNTQADKAKKVHKRGPVRNPAPKRKRAPGKRGTMKVRGR